MSVGGKAITYSEAAPLNPQTYDGKTFEFEGRRLVRVTSDTMEAVYKYDDTGLRVQKTVTEDGVTTTTKYVYDGSRLIAEYTGASRVDYLYDENGMLYGFIYNNAKYFYIRDTLQNILGIVDANGIAVVHYDYTAYGKCNAITGSMASTIGVINSFRYKGYYFDKETGYFYCRSRYYLPDWCRWLNTDHPAFLDVNSIHKTNLFCYCNDSPIMYADESGYIAWWVILIIVVATAIATDHAVNGIMSTVADNKIEDTYTIETAKDEIEKISGEDTVRFGSNSVQIKNSTNVISRYKRIKISKIIQNTVDEDGNKLTSRSTYSLSAEWFGHNLLYWCHINRTTQTQHVDLDYRFDDNQIITKVGTVALMILGLL